MTRHPLIVLGLVVNLVSPTAGLPANQDHLAEICGTTLPMAESTTKAEHTNVPTARCENGTPHSVRLSWKPSLTLLSSPEPGSYTVYRWEQQGGACRKVKVELVDTAYEDCDVKEGHTYRYTVTAVKGDDESKPSNVVEALIQ